MYNNAPCKRCGHCPHCGAPMPYATPYTPYYPPILPYQPYPYPWYQNDWIPSDPWCDDTYENYRSWASSSTTGGLTQ